MNSLIKFTFAICALCAICSAANSGEENDGLYQGDIAGINPYQDAPNRRGISINGARKWTGGVIYWKYNDESEYTSELRTKYEAGMKWIEDATRIGSINCITFKKVSASNLPSNYVNISDHGGCWSYLGMLGGAQEMSLTPRCSSGNVAHEFIHALGFDHEQNRPDRDQFVKVNLDNIKTENARNYFKKTEAQTTTFGFSYDFDSIMHYGETFFVKDASLKAMTPVNPLPSGVRMGQRDHLSETDIKEIQAKYECTGSTNTGGPADTTRGPAVTTRGTAPALGNGKVRIVNSANGDALNAAGTVVTMEHDKTLPTEVFELMNVGAKDGNPMVVFFKKDTSLFLSSDKAKLGEIKLKLVAANGNSYSVSAAEVFVLSASADVPGAVNIRAYDGGLYVNLFSNHINYAYLQTANILSASYRIERV